MIYIASKTKPTLLNRSVQKIKNCLSGKKQMGQPNNKLPFLLILPLPCPILFRRLPRRAFQAPPPSSYFSQNGIFQNFFTSVDFLCNFLHSMLFSYLHYYCTTSKPRINPAGEHFFLCPYRLFRSLCDTKHHQT